MFGIKVLRWCRRAVAGPRFRIAGDMVRRADAARDAGHYRDASLLYGEAARLGRDGPGLQVQHGNALKEVGDFAGAEARYLAALAYRPDDPDLALQLGHLHKASGRLADADASYRRAAALKPEWPDALLALADLADMAARRAAAAAAAAIVTRADAGADPDHVDAVASGLFDRLVPELAPRRPADLLRRYEERVDVRQLGSRGGQARHGMPTLRGIEAVRGICISEVDIIELQIVMSGVMIHRGPVRGGYDLPLDAEPGRWKKYVFNVWHDFSTFADGEYACELRLVDQSGASRSHHDRVLVRRPLPESMFPDSDALVNIDPADPRSIDRQVEARPSIVRTPERRLFAVPPRAILVQRTDQLGDTVASIPAMIRLRALFPDARIVGLLTAANRDFAATLGLFDEVVTIDFPDDDVERRRLMSLADQEALRRRLEPYAFDLAIDLSQAGVSRPLLRLSGAPFLYGVGDGAWPWLSAGIDFNTHDPLTRLDVVPHSAKVLAMVEALGALIANPMRVIRRADLSRDRLAAFGIARNDRYVLLHGGARIAFSRWPHHAALVRLILDGTDRKVVLLADDPAIRATLPGDLLADDRFRLLNERLSFDDFDALVSFADALVGNDSGPKHLASLRGVDAITLFTNRINWAEWGQEAGGAIVTRKVPCAGCAIFHDADECGRDFVCIRGIRPEEVFDTLGGVLRAGAVAPAVPGV